MAQGQDQKDHNLPIVMLVMVIFVGFVLWFRLRAVIVYPLFVLDDGIYSCFSLFGLSPTGQSYLTYVRAILGSATYLHDMTFADLLAVQKATGVQFRYVGAAVMFAAAAFIAMKAPEATMVRNFIFRGGKYGESHIAFGRKLPKFFSNFPVPGKKKVPGFVPVGKDFLNYQSNYWKASITNAYFDQYRKDENWRPADNELDVARKAGVKLVSSLETPKLLEQYLGAQLTVHWEGIRKAPIQAQAIAALVVVNKRRNLKKRDDLAGELAMCAIPHQPVDWERMAAVIKPILSDKVVQVIDQIASKHAFLKTAMLAIYGYGGPFREWGGRAGTLPPALFLWLRGVDRGLWYTLQCVGRPSYFVEACCVVAHFKYERMLSKPVRAPYIKAAVSGLINTLKSMNIEDVEKYHSSLAENME